MGEGSRDGGNGEKQGPWICGQGQARSGRFEKADDTYLWHSDEEEVPVLLWVKRLAGNGRWHERPKAGKKRNRGL